MKTKITMLMMLLLSISLTVNAQTDTKTYHDQMKVLMSQLDSTRFKNNTLYEWVYPLVCIIGKQQTSKDCFSRKESESQ